MPISKDLRGTFVSMKINTYTDAFFPRSRSAPLADLTVYMSGASVAYLFCVLSYYVSSRSEFHVVMFATISP